MAKEQQQRIGPIARVEEATASPGGGQHRARRGPTQTGQGQPRQDRGQSPVQRHRPGLP